MEFEDLVVSVEMGAVAVTGVIAPEFEVAAFSDLHTFS